MKRSLVASLPVIALITACASKPVQTVEHQNILRDTVASRTGLVTAGCVTRNQFGDDLLLTEASSRMAEAMRVQSLAHLASAGVQPVKSANVLICPGHVTGESPGFKVKPNRDIETTLPAQYPIGIDPQVRNDAALAAAYDALFRALVQAGQPAEGVEQDRRQPVALAITPRDLELIRSHVEVDRLWVVNGATGMVSFAKSFLTGMATGLVSAATLGIGYVAQPVNGSEYQVNLVALSNGQRLWRGQMGGPGGVDLSDELRVTKPEQKQTWANTLYAPLIAERVAESPGP